MAKYKVLTPVEHDGVRYEAGKSIELEDEHAKPLLAVKAIFAGKGKGAATDDAAGTGSGDDAAGTGSGDDK